MTKSFVMRLDHNVRLIAEFTSERSDVLSYSLALVLEEEAGDQTVRVFDSAHGFNEMHRYTRTGGKQAGEAFHAGTLGEGMRDAIADCKQRFFQMIEGWDR